MIKGIIFDIDGVLLDSLGVWNDLGARYLRSIGVQPEEGLNRILFPMSMEEGADYLKKHYRLEESSTGIMNGLGRMLEAFYFEEVLPKPGAKELMEYMKSRGIRMAAATSSPKLHVEKALKRNGMLDHLEKIFTESEVKADKHSPDIYYAASGLIGTEPVETLVFEDSLYALKTAKAAGFVTVGVFDANGEPDQEGVKNTGDHYITDMKEVIEIYERRYE